MFKGLFAATALLTMATAAPMAANAQTEITVWFHAGQGSERDAFNTQVNLFNDSQSDIVVNAVQLPDASYNDQVNAAALAGDLPDLLDFDGPFIANYVWSGFLQPLDEGLVDQAIIDDLLPSIVNQGTYPGDDKLYSIGVFDSGLGLWGNKTLLEKAGARIPAGVDDAWSLEEFEQILTDLAALEEVEWPLDLKLNYGRGEWYTYGFSPILQSLGGDLIDRDQWNARDALTNDGAVRAMEIVQGWINDDWVVPASAGDTKFYGDKTVGVSLVGMWMWQPHNEGLGDDLLLLPMPKFGDRHATGMGSWNWGITSGSDNPEAAATFLEFLLQPEEIIRMTTANGAVPARVSAIAMSDLYADGGPLSLYIDQLEAIAVPRPFHPGYPTITSAFAEAFDNIVAGGDVNDELAKAARKIDEDIEDNAGYPPFGN